MEYGRISTWTPPRKSGGISWVSTRFGLIVENEQVGRGTGRSNPPRETKFSAATGDRKKTIFPVRLTMTRIGNVTRLIYSLLYVMVIQNMSYGWCFSIL